MHFPIQFPRMFFQVQQSGNAQIQGKELGRKVIEPDLERAVSCSGDEQEAEA